MYKFPCLEYVGNNPQFRKASEKFAAKLFGKLGISREDMYVLLVSTPGLSSSFSIVPEDVGDDFDCKDYACKTLGIDMGVPGNDVCRACSICCGEHKMTLDDEEKEFLSYLFSKGPAKADEVFRILNESAFSGYSLVSEPTNTMEYPMCVPLARIIYGVAKNNRGLFSQICEDVSSLSVSEPTSGKVVTKKNAVKINEEFLLLVIDGIASYCNSEKVRDYLRNNKSVLWSHLAKNYITYSNIMSDEYAERFLMERGEESSEEYVAADEFGTFPAEEVLTDVSAPEKVMGDVSEEIGEPVAEGVSNEDYKRILEENERLKKEVYTDALTGVFNAKAYRDIAVVGQHRCAIYVDINNLKYINDVVGSHETGDQLITCVAEVLKGAFGDVYRVGGDEFITFSEKDEDDIKSLIADVKKRLDDVTNQSENGVVYSISAGYAFAEGDENIYKVVQRAEGFMKADKKRYKMAHPEFDVRGEYREKDKDTDEKKAGEAGDEAGKESDGAEEVSDDEKVFTPVEGVESHPYFTKKVDMTEGGYLSDKDSVRRIPMRNRRYIIPFAENDLSTDIDRNVIVHHEITQSDIGLYDEKGVRRKVFELKTNSGDEQIETELDNLLRQATSDRKVACEIAYVTDSEKYVLLMWNASSRRMDYFVLITKKGEPKTAGAMMPIPRQIIEIFKREGIKKVCYQPYLLYAMMGLYVREVEIKNVHSIYSNYFVFNERTGGMENSYDGVMNSYTSSVSEKVNDRLGYMERIFGSSPRFMQLMGVYCEIARMQFDYSDAFGYGALCASRHRKDLMYGYSYLAAGVIPSMQKALFKLTPKGQIVFFNKPEPSISYFEGYMVQYMFRNINSDPGENGEVKEANEKSNVRARQLLLKDLATVGKGFYHTNIKILYFDEYYMIFYMAHNYLVQNQQFIETALKRECTMHKIVTDQFLYSCWATTFDMVRLVNKH